MMSPAVSRQSVVADLRRQVERLEGVHPAQDEQLISTGSPPLDGLLPGGGLRRGLLVEYLSSGAGSGAGTLALCAAREACASGQALIVVDRRRTFYPPAAAAWGIDLNRMLILQPADEAAELWAIDQALQCSGVGAVFAPCGALDVREFRRLQLAAETGGTLGILLRPARFRAQPSWAEVQWGISRVGQARIVSADPRGDKAALREHRLARRSPVSSRGSSLRSTHPTAWRLRVELTRCRGGPAGQAVVVELDETTGIWREATGHAPHPLHSPAELAHPIRLGRTRRA